MRHPLPFALSFALAAVLAFFVTSVALAFPAEAAPPLPPAPAAGNVEATNSADEVIITRQPSAPQDIPSTGITVTVDIPLTAGWNLVAVPVKRTPTHTAQSALNEIGGQGGNCSEVDRWLNGGWDAHINGLPFNDFSVAPSMGYFVKCTTSSTWHVTGELIMAPVQLNLTPGWNLVALPYGPHADQAQAWLNDIIAQGGTATEVDRWLNGGWDAHINGLPFNDFAISKTQGYFIRMGNAVSYAPEPPTQNVCGTISTNTTWTSDKIWLLTCDVIVNSGITFTVEAGTVVKFQGSWIGLTINGLLNGQGANLDRVAFTSFKDDAYGGDSNDDGNASLPHKGDWGRIRLDGGSEAHLDYAIVRYGAFCSSSNFDRCFPETERGALRVDGGVLTLDQSVVEFNGKDGGGEAGDGIWASNDATVEIRNSTLRDNSRNGLMLGTTHPVIIENCLFSNNRGSGADIWAQTATVTGNMFTGNGGDGLQLISLGELPEVHDNIFDDNLGLAARIEYHSGGGGSAPVLANNSGSGNHVNGIRIYGKFTVTSTLALNPSLPYIVDALAVEAGTTLTLTAGTVFKVADSYRSISIKGRLIAPGAADNPIVFTSFKDDAHGGDTNGDGNATLPHRGDWGNIRLTDGGQAFFDYVIVRYGAFCSSAYLTRCFAETDKGALRTEGGVLTVDHSIVEFNGKDGGGEAGDGIWASGDAIVDIRNTVVRNNSSNGLFLGSAHSLIVQSVTSSGNSGNGAILWGPAVSVVNSTFTGNGGNGLEAISPDEPPDVHDNTFTNNGGLAAKIMFNYGGGGSTPMLANNSGGGNQMNGIHIYGTFTVTSTLAANPALPYIFDWLAVETGTTLTLTAGTVLKAERAYSSMSIRGRLIAPGTADHPIIFTSFKDDAYGGDTNGDGNSSQPQKGDWENLKLRPNSQAVLDHIVLRYGGFCHSGYIRCMVEDDYGGINVDSAELTVINSSIEKNGGIPYGAHGVYAYGTATTQIHNSIIRDNTQLGVVGNGMATTDAQHNWWGSDSGPAPYGSGNGINYASCYDSLRQVYYICLYYVDAYPWIGMDVAVGGQLGHAGPTSSNQAFEADPVNTANGNYAYQRTDVSIPTRGLPLEITRAYNSLVPQTGPLGYGWTHAWNLRLAENSGDNTVVVTFGDGHSEKWTWTGATYDGAPGVHGVLVKNGDGTFDLTQKDQTRYHFTSAGQLAWVDDRNANRTTLAYDGSGKLITVTEPAGRSLTLEYTSPVSPTLISRITDHVSRFTQYMYDTAANLVTVTDVTGQATTMTYDANHRLLTMTDANGHTFVRNVYDANDRVAEQYDADNNKWTFAYDEPGHFTLVTNPRGYVTTYTYDGDWRLVSEKDPLNYTVTFAYDADNNRTRMTDKRGNATFFGYDSRGNTTIITDTLGGGATLTYDTSGTRNNLLSHTDALSRTTIYVYDAHSNLVQRTNPPNSACPAGCITSWTYDGFGQLASTTDGNGHVTTTTYNANGNLTAIADALGHTTSAVYDTAGRKLSETDALGRVTAYTYDAANRLLTVTQPLGKSTAYTYDAVGNRTAVTENGTRTTTYAYDAKDRLASVADPLGHTTTYGYDSVDNQTSVADPLGHTTTYTYDALNRRASVTDALNNTTSYQYDPNGNRTRLTDANGKATNYSYDQLNRLITVQDAAGGEVSYGYDALGNRLSMTDANSHVTTYSYDTLNRLATVTDPLSHVVSYGYDALGNRTSHTKADGNVLTYGFDAVNRPVTITYPGGAVTYSYDAVGNRLSMTDPAGTTTYTFDNLDRLIQVAGPKGALSYTYDLFGSRTSITYPGGDTVNYTYDAANRLSTVMDYGSRVTQYAYDDANRPTTIAYPNGVQAAYIYDNADHLLSLVHTSPVSGTIASATYTVDNVGNRLNMVDLDGTSSYTYDNLYRLTQVIYPGGETVSYAYDPMGNRLSMTSSLHGVTTYSYDVSDRLLSFADPGGTTTLTWDANGNMTGKGGAAYTFDALDRLAQVVSGTLTVQFAYNGDGVRLGKAVNGSTTDYLQDVAAPLPLVLSETTAGQTSRYVYGSDLLMLEDPASTPSFYHHDGLGSTRALSNEMGQRTGLYNYDVFGRNRNQTGQNNHISAFSGEQIDVETGFVFLRARYSDPETGRFITRDPLPGASWRTQDINRYVYAVNHPVNHTDPSGLSYAYSRVRIGIFAFLGVNVEVGYYLDDTGEATWIVSGGGGVGLGAGLTSETGYSTGDVPGSGPTLETRAGFIDPSLSLEYDIATDTSCVQGGSFSVEGGICAGQGRLDTTVAWSPSSVDAEASATLNWRFPIGGSESKNQANEDYPNPIPAPVPTPARPLSPPSSGK